MLGEHPSIRNRIKNAYIAIRLFRNFHVFMFHYFFSPAQKMITCNLRNGIKLRIRNRTSDFLVIREIFMHHIYDASGFEIKPTDTIIDIGGHIGTFSVYTSRQNHKGKIYTFEPMPENYEILIQNIELNKCPHAIPINKAVATATEVRALNICDYGTGTHSFYPIKNSLKNSITVQTITMQEALQSHSITHIDLMKIDCEGAERELLQTWPDEIFSITDKMILETHPEFDSPPELISSILTSKGYAVSSREHRMLYAKKKSLEQ